MAVPPPYTAPKRANKSGLIIALVVGAALICCVLPIVGLFAGGNWFMRNGMGFVGCAMSFNLVPRAIENYAAENGGKLPNAATWMDDVRPYYAKLVENEQKEAGPFKLMPAEGVWGCTEGERMTGIVYNSELSGKLISDIQDKANTVLIFESPKSGANLAEKYAAPAFDESPNLMGMSQKRGWYVATMDGVASLVDKSGSRAKVDTTGRSSGTSTKLGPIEIQSKESSGTSSGN